MTNHEKVAHEQRGPFVSTIFEYGHGGRDLGLVSAHFGRLLRTKVVSVISALTRLQLSVWSTTE